jgi:hypothetical protein
MAPRARAACVQTVYPPVKTPQRSWSPIQPLTCHPRLGGNGSTAWKHAYMKIDGEMSPHDHVVHLPSRQQPYTD